jgi:hypothetical protein
MSPNSFVMIAVMAPVGVPVLRVAVALALIVFVFCGIFIFRKRPQSFDRDPNFRSYGSVVQHSREELIIIVGSALMLLLVGILHQVWSV